MSGDSLIVMSSGEEGHHWQLVGRAQGAAKHLTMCRAAPPPPEDDPAQVLSRAPGERLGYELLTVPVSQVLNVYRTNELGYFEACFQIEVWKQTFRRLQISFPPECMLFLC